MFTGLIEDVGSFASLTESARGWNLAVHTSLPLDEVKEDDSIAVNGTCLTVEARKPSRGILVFHVLHETLSLTTLHSLGLGDAVNLERATRADDRLGGHIVTGHVDACARVRSVMQAGGDLSLTVTLPECIQEQVVVKGSIAINGVSLTIVSLHDDSLTVRLIPETWQRTNLQYLRSDEMVNLEADVIGKFVQRQLTVQSMAAGSSPLTIERLEQAGFAS